MTNVINYENFNIENIKMSVEHKKYLYCNETYQFKKIIPKYVYEDGTEDDIYIQIPEVFSYGIKTFENKNDQAPSHSFSFVLDVKPNDDDINEEKAKEMTTKTIKIFEQILEKFKLFLAEEAVMKKLEIVKKKLWTEIVDEIKPFLSYQTDKETKEIIEGSSPTLFLKLKTENDKKKNPSIKSVFRQFNSHSEEIEDISPTLLPDLFQNVRCMATGVVHIESIYIPKTNSVSIQHKLHEVLITEVMKKNVNRIQLPQRFMKKNKIDKIFDSDDDSDSGTHNINKLTDSDHKSDDDNDDAPSNSSKPIIVKKVIRRINNQHNEQN